MIAQLNNIHLLLPSSCLEQDYITKLFSIYQIINMIMQRIWVVAIKNTLKPLNVEFLLHKLASFKPK